MSSIETDENGVISRRDDRGQLSHVHADHVWIRASDGRVGIAAEGVRIMLTPGEGEMVATLDRVISAGKIVT